ncbi:putative secreted protein (Por secretion system target) [Salegentibacter sp. 24]|uniref:Ig-like domain-containing protein n=1 Tax=Salegentibacter sp. 24 TaxID=2183986 RepID=UPI00106144F0|nr:LamG-like jellyroll fold domain-containing protein [Salegentibacter sp. 24]TDN81808.1 putative secreted protein (Por secretion system target) [Salegentibacter sp. 24]
MGKKLLSICYLFIFLFLMPALVFGQCPGENQSTSISISTSDPTTFCKNEEISFTAALNNAGTNPAIVWKINGNANGQSGLVFTTSSLSNGDKVSASVVSDCDPKITANSNVITVTVNDLSTPTVSISASTSTICQGEAVTFSATNTNGGTSPSYQWFINGASQGAASSNNTFSTSGLSNNDVVSAQMLSNATCAQPSTVTSNQISITVNDLLAPGVEIQVSDSEICQGEEIRFEAINLINEGSNPNFQWKVNGVNAGSNNTVFTTTNLSNNDQVSLEMTSNAQCVDAAVNPASSNVISIIVNPLITPGVSIQARDNPEQSICQGEAVTFDATPTNGGTSPSYQWKVNGNNAGTNSSAFTTSSLSNGDRISVVMTSNIECVDEAANPATSELLTMEVKPILNPEVSISASKTLICAGTGVTFTATALDAGANPTYEWFINGFSQGTPSTNNIFSVSNLSDGQEVWAKVIPTDNCAQPATATSNSIPVEVLSNVPSKPLDLAGPIAVCPVATGLTYQVTNANDPNITYNWVPPSGWSITSGQGTHKIVATAGNNSATGDLIMKVTAENICGSSLVSELVVAVDDFVETNAGEDLNLCKDVNSIPIAGQVNFGGGPGNSGNSKLNPRWSTSDGTGSFGNVAALSTTFTPTSAQKQNGSVTLILSTDTPKGACQAGRDEMTIYFYQDATADAGEYSPICQGETIDLSGTMGGSADNVVWSSTGGSFSDPNSLNPTFTPNTTGEIELILTSSGPCTPDATDRVIISVNELPTVDVAEDKTICSNGTADLTATIGGGATSGSWSTSGDGSFDTVNSTSATYTPGENDKSNGIATITFTSNDPDGPCEATSDAMELTIEPEVLVDAGEDFSICSDTTANLLATVSGGTNTGVWSSATGGSFSNPNALNTIYTPSETDVNSGNVILTFTSDDPTGECGAISDDISIAIDPAVEIEAGEDLNVCSGGTIELSGANLSGGASTAAWEIISGGGSLSLSSQTATPETVTYTAAGNLSETVVLRLASNDPAGSCAVLYDEISITVHKAPVITTQPSNTGVCSTEYAEFNVVATGDQLSYQWYKDNQPLEGATSKDLIINQATATNAGRYYVEVSGAESCAPVISDEVSLNVDEDIQITAQSEDKTLCVSQGSQGVSFNISAAANGSELVFEWFKDGAVISDAQTSVTTTQTNGVYTSVLNIANVALNHDGNYAAKISGSSSFTCPEADSRTFVLSVNDNPSPPVTEDIIYCQFDTPAALSVVSGTNLKWYSSIDAEQALESVPVADTQNFGQTSYWVSQTPDNCESARAEVKVIVKEKPGLPGVEDISYCSGQTAQELSASVTTDASLTWYDSQDGEALVSAPIPNTENPGKTTYWVSQTPNDGFGCESDRAPITVTINELPQVTISIDESIVLSDEDNPVICLSSSIELTGNGALTYTWNTDSETLGSGSSLSVSPEATTTYYVTGTDGNQCSNTSEITIEVDEQSLGGTVSGSTNVCQGSNTGTLNLTDHKGEILRWESSTDNWATELVIDNTTTSLTYTDITATTAYRAVVKNGICEAVESEAATISVDPISVGGEVFVQGTTNKTLLVCHQADEASITPLELVGATGDVIRWEYSSDSGINWIPIALDATPNIQGYEGITETRLYRAIVKSGSCSEAASAVAIISVIPNQKPSPVEARPAVVCLGEDVELFSESSFATGRDLASGGTFNNANPEGWLADGCGNCLNSGGSNTKETGFRLSATNGGTYSGVNYTSDNKFAISNGNYNSIMETPVFNLIGIADGSLEFSHSYKLVGDAEIYVEISTDGGTNYSKVLWEQREPGELTPHQNFHNSSATEMDIDLTNYLGLSNLRIRFVYQGTTNSSWAIDNVTIPDAPVDERMEWVDEQTGEVISTTETATVTPLTPGINYYSVTSYINGCRSFGEEGTEIVEVFAYDSFTTEAAIAEGQSTACGNNAIQLTAKVISAYQTGQDGNGEITEFTPDDTFTARWTVQGMTETESNAYFDDPSKPGAIFSSDTQGDYVLLWTITPKNVSGQPDNPCAASVVEIPVSIRNCQALDFDGVDDYVDLGKTYTGNYSLEAWVRPEASSGTIISGPSFEINVEDLPGNINVNTRWYHIAVSNNTLYVDGIDIGSLPMVNSGERALIGARWNNENASAENYFTGWIEEVRIWNTTITVEQIRFMMNQRLYNNGTQMGMQIPMDVPGGLSFDKLQGYYQLLADPDLLSGGTTPDLSNTAIAGRLVNIETFQENTAPLPYTSVASGEWETRTTWTEPIVWDFPNSTGINGEAIEWNIVRTAHDINSGNKNIRVLGLLSQSGTLDIFNPSGSHNQSNTGQFLSISHYLLLNGIIDLTGESQLLQDVGSIVDPASSGYLERDQQGTANSFNYNYWSFPVSSGASNAGGSIRGLLKDGSNSNAPGDISFGYDHTYADNYDYNTGAKRISGYWLFKFFGTANVYGEWKWIGENGQLNTGDGFTMKGTSGAVPIATRQNYVFRGLPNNGPVDGLSIGANQNRLTGNPYPSALDAKQFILDNLNSADVSGATNTRNIFNGALYFWDHFGEENTHILREYVGGYATINLAGTVASATSSDERINDNNASSSKRPGQFVPVGQGFFINTVLDESLKNGISIPGGEVVFNNAQRAFVTETDPDDSYFLKPIYPSKKQKTVGTKDTRYKIRLNFTSPQGYLRQILVTADANTTKGFDLGYDAPLMDDLSEDMYWLIQKGKFVIQGAPHFNLDQNFPIGLKISEEKEFTIGIGALENLPDITDIYLLDKRDSTYHDLRKEAYKASLPVGEYQDLYEIVFDDVTTAREDKEPGEGPIDYIYSLENSEFIISNPELHKIDHINIYNIAGQLVDQHFGIPDIKEIHIPQKKSLSSAVYIVKVYTSAGDYAKKVIIRKN